MDDSFMAVHYSELIAASTRDNLPAIFVAAPFAREGGLISGRADPTGLFRGAAGYVDRILRGENPADLPVQGPTKFEMIRTDLKRDRLIDQMRVHEIILPEKE
jgi:putative ABC transport system substrate-binding protein